MKIDLKNKYLIVIAGHILYAFIYVLYSSQVDDNEKAGFVALSHLFWLFSTLIIFCILFLLIKFLVSKKKILPTFFSEDSFLTGLYVIIFLKIYLSGIPPQVFTSYWVLVAVTIVLMAHVLYHLILSNKTDDGYAPTIFFVLTLLFLSAYLDYVAMNDVCSLDWVEPDKCRIFK